MPPSPVRKLVPFALKAKQNGTKVYHLNIGQPDIETPETALNALKNIDLKVLEYALSEGNLEYRKVLTENGMKLSGISPDGRIVEMVEIPSHPWFLATQAHPELKSRPNRPHPLFRGFIKAALDYQENK